MSSIGRIGRIGMVDRDRPSDSVEMMQQRRADKPERNAQLDAAAKLYEKQFLGEMMKAMRATVTPGGDKPSMGEAIYREQLDQQYVDTWGERGGIGLADLIYDQVNERYFNNGLGKQEKPQGPLAITDRDVSKVIRVKTTDVPGQTPLRIELEKSADGKPAKLQAPWSGEVVSNTRLEGGKTALTLKHNDNVSSTLIFQGVASGDAQPGVKFEKGKTVAVLSPETKSFMWNINKETKAEPDLRADQKMQDKSVGPDTPPGPSSQSEI